MGTQQIPSRASWQKKQIAVLAAGLGLLVMASVAVAATSSATNPKALPLGDNHVTTAGAKTGWIYVCQKAPAGTNAGAFTDGPWIHGSTFDLTAKAVVDGSVSWPNASVSIKVVGSKRVIKTNGLPKGEPTGTFPISSSDDAYRYDRNPNSIQAQTYNWSIPASPKAASKPNCLSGGPIGMTTDGVPLYDALDAADRDGVAHELQDACGGHPQQQGAYHYHTASACLLKGASTKKASPLVGYAIDGFPIYGPRGAGGKLYTNAQLDACHGHTVTTKVNGKTVKSYRYQATLEYPYTLGCYHGTPAVSSHP